MTEPFSFDACPLRVGVSVVRFTDPDTGTPRGHEMVAGDARAESMLAGLMMKAVIDPTALDAVGGVPRRRERHPEDCPLCALHSRPGPRIWGRWIVEPWQGDPAYRDTATGARPHRGVELFANDAHARETVDELYRMWTAHARELHDCLPISDLHAYVDQSPRMATRLVTGGSQLWMWDRPSCGWWPERVLRFGDDGVEELTGVDVARMHETGRVPGGVLGAPAESLVRPNHFEVGDFVVRVIGEDPDVLLVSILDRSSRKPARRILSDGRREPLGAAVRGLTVYGRYAGDRPMVEELPRLTPEYADLVTAIHREFRRGARV
ncbi:hypothetical protein ACWEKT_40045 [Nocardia takedensis]